MRPDAGTIVCSLLTVGAFRILPVPAHLLFDAVADDLVWLDVVGAIEIVIPALTERCPRQQT